MIYRHKNLAEGGWFKLALVEQLANVGSEIHRAINWREKNKEYSRKAFERALELLDITAADEKNRKRLKEIMRLREALADYFVFENSYHSSDESWQKYFMAFNWAARINS